MAGMGAEVSAGHRERSERSGAQQAAKHRHSQSGTPPQAAHRALTLSKAFTTTSRPPQKASLKTSSAVGGVMGVVYCCGRA